ARRGRAGRELPDRYDWDRISGGQRPRRSWIDRPQSPDVRRSRSGRGNVLSSARRTSRCPSSRPEARPTRAVRLSVGDAKGSVWEVCSPRFRAETYPIRPEITKKMRLSPSPPYAGERRGGGFCDAQTVCYPRVSTLTPTLSLPGRGGI